MPRVSRQPSHAGSWYTEDPAVLSEEIDSWMASAASSSSSGEADTSGNEVARAIIGPHAGYRYCGHVMAYAYKHIRPESVKRVFLLGPSHHFYSRKCLLSTAATYETPLGPLEIDQDIFAELRKTGLFDPVGLSEDEAEHSLELHTPFIARVMKGQSFKLVPIVVGALATDAEAQFGKALAPYLDDPSNLFVISSDFCHWGRRFSYVEYIEEQGEIWQSIKWLDQQGMDAIETGQPEVFAQYLARWKNTICGRHPIGVLLNMLPHCSSKFEIKFKCYDQSSRCKTAADSSVSYAAAVISQVAP